MPIQTCNDLITLALKACGAIGVGQTQTAEDQNDAFAILNMIISEWQLNRWLVTSLVDVVLPSNASPTYTVGPTGAFVFNNQRPDKIDAIYAVDGSNTSWYLFPFMSREGYDRVLNKTQTGIPEAFFYDSALSGNGTLFFTPIPDATYTLHVQAKASLGQFSSLTAPLNLPQIYTSALFWNLSSQLRPLYQLPADERIDLRAATSLQAMINSIAQVPQAVQPVASNRAGIFSNQSPVQQGASQ